MQSVVPISLCPLRQKIKNMNHFSNPVKTFKVSDKPVAVGWLLKTVFTGVTKCYPKNN
jgi:hypothetical protein